MLKKITISALIMLVILCLAVYKMYNKPHKNIAKSKPDVQLTHDKLVNAFIADEDKANAQYLDKVVEVTGPIVKINHEENKTIISLGKGDLFGNIDCHMSVDNKNLVVGEKVTIKGVCTGYLMNVVLVRCVLKN